MNLSTPANCLATLLTSLVLLAPVVPADQQAPDAEPVHWAYAAFLGTGWYKLNDNRQVYVLRVPPRWHYKESAIDESGQRTAGIEFHFPVTFGLHKLDQIDDLVDFGNIGTVSFNPGVEIEYPVSKRWYTRAYAHLGWGKEHDSKESAWIYEAGLKSRYSLQKGKLGWGIINQVFFAGHDGKSSKSDSLSGMLAGLDFSYPIGPKNRARLKLDWDIAYRWYGNDLSFLRAASDPVSIQDEWEIGIAIAKIDGPIRVWFLNLEHLGLSYRFNSDGSFSAVTVNFSTPFKR